MLRRAARLIDAAGRESDPSSIKLHDQPYDFNAVELWPWFALVAPVPHSLCAQAAQEGDFLHLA